MPPKSRSKSHPKAEPKKKPGGKKAPSSPVVSDKKQADLTFLEEVSPNSEAADMQKVFQLLGFGIHQGDRQYVKAACQTLERICEELEVGLMTFIEAKGVESMLALVRYIPGAHVSPSMSEAVNGAAATMYRSAASWLDAVDEVNFDQLSNVLHFAHWLGSEDEDVALSSLAAMERFTLHRTEHAATLLENNVLQVLHRIIGHNRAPELVTEAFTLLFRLTDNHAAGVVPLMVREAGLIQTVVESMSQAPLNMRLQLAGMRLLAMWSALVIPPDAELPLAENEVKDLKEFIKQAKAEEVSREIISNLSRSGLSHAAGWMSAIASRLPRTHSKKSVEGHQRSGRRASATAKHTGSKGRPPGSKGANSSAGMSRAASTS